MLQRALPKTLLSIQIVVCQVIKHSENKCVL